MKKLSLLFATFAILFSSGSYAQTTENKWAVFVGAHATDFTAKYGLFDGFFNTDDWTIVPPLSKLTVARSLNKLFVVDLTASVGEISTKDAGTVANLNISDEFFLNAGLGLRLKLLANDMILKQTSFFDPYARVGASYLKYDYTATPNGTPAGTIVPGGKTNNIARDDNFAVQFGAGINLWLAKGFGINMASDYNWIPESEGRANLDFFQHTLGVAFRFGAKKEVVVPPVVVEPEPEPVGEIDVACVDIDNDTICDVDDECPNDPLNECNINISVLQETIENVYFEFNKYNLTAQSQTDLNNAATILNQGPTKNTYWILEGHTDAIGSDAYNMKLSQERADDVKNYLVSKGVDASRLKAVGYGESMPIATNSTDAGRAKNRRVEFKIADQNFNVKALKLNDNAAKEQVNKYAKKIYFEVGSAQLKPASGASLDIIAEYIKISGKTWNVGGHTDNTGSDAINKPLSQKRAQAVVDYLVSKGVPASSIVAIGYGSSQPVADNKTVDGRAENRRIEFSAQ